jgi:hypothetical protein
MLFYLFGRNSQGFKYIYDSKVIPPIDMYISSIYTIGWFFMSEKIYLFQRSKVRPTPCGMVVKEFSSILRPKLCELRSNILLSTRKDTNTQGMHIILAMRKLCCKWENPWVIGNYNWWTPKQWDMRILVMW